MRTDLKHACWRAIVVAAAAALPLAQAQTPASPASQSSSPGGGMSMQHGSSMDMMSMMKDHQATMTSMPMTGNQDVDFARMMRLHHMGGIRMAEMELKSGKDPQMQKMARKTISEQKKEVAELERFLAKKGHAVDKQKK